MKIGAYERLVLFNHKPIPANQGVQIGYVKYTWPRLICMAALWLVLCLQPYLWIGLGILIYMELLTHKAAAQAVRAQTPPPPPPPAKPTQTNMVRRPTSTAVAGPGWYPDPSGGPVTRYWTGESWSDKIASR